jgi:RNA recognition motif-containing protein
MQLYVGNLPYTISEDDLRSMFTPHGEVTRATIIKDRETGRSKGFGFVDMPDNAQGDAAIAALNGADMKGRPLKVNVSEPKKDGPRPAFQRRPQY